MKNDRIVIPVLSVLAMVLLLVASLAAIIADDGGVPYHFTSPRGERVEIYGGAGPYRYDNTYKAIAFRSFDWTNLAVVLPLFGLGLASYRRGRLRGQLLLAALFTYLAYIYLIGVMGNAFNTLFLVWTALFSIGLFGLCRTLAELDFPALPVKLAARFPRKSVAIYIVSVGLILLVQYLAEVIVSYTTGNPPASLDHYTTLELASLELGIMIPLHIIGGLTLWKGKTWGYLTTTLLAFTSFMVFVALSVSLLLFYVSFGRGDVLDMAITTVIAIVATGFSLAIFKRVQD
ncbi:MAG: hypothetical protein JXA21_14970 [Anaerolineae bacterium]|nr:hypothetical protein [Anaerolineae bacterium]